MWVFRHEVVLIWTYLTDPRLIELGVRTVKLWNSKKSKSTTNCYAIGTFLSCLISIERLYRVTQKTGTFEKSQQNYKTFLWRKHAVDHSADPWLLNGEVVCSSRSLFRSAANCTWLPLCISKGPVFLCHPVYIYIYIYIYIKTLCSVFRQLLGSIPWWYCHMFTYVLVVLVSKFLPFFQIHLTLNCIYSDTIYVIYSRGVQLWFSLRVTEILKRQSSPVTGLEWPRGFHEVKVPRFHDNGTGWW